MEAIGIKETLECFNAIDAAADAVVGACADGRLNMLDIPKLLAPMKAAKAALDGKEVIPSELKDVDENELAELVTRGLRTTEKIVLAITAVSALKP